MKKAAPRHSSPTPEEIIGTVKKVMNTVFRSLKSQFLDEETYLGSNVLQTLQIVIRVMVPFDCITISDSFIFHL